MIISIGSCYCLEFHNAITSYLGVKFLTNESSIICTYIIEQIRLCLVEFHILDKEL